MSSNFTEPPQQPAWAAPPVQLVDTEPLEYHRLLRGIPRYRWWKPLVFLLVAGAVFGAFSLIVGAVWLGIVFVRQPGIFSLDSEAAATSALLDELMLDTQNPLSVAMSMISVIIMIPSVWIGMLAVGIRPLGRIWSVAARIRWGLLWRSLGIAVLAIIVTNILAVGLGILMDPGSLAETSSEPPQIDVRAALISFVLVLVLVPLQATAEEVVFRGAFMQILGAWLRNPWFAILIPSVGFALSHIYDVWGMLVVGLMGLAAGWLTWRTGGLEAAIGIHIVNNLFAFGVLASGVTGETAQTAEGAGPALVIAEVGGLALFVWLVDRSFRKHRYGRARIDRVEVPVAPPSAEQQWPPQPPVQGAPGV